VTQRDLKRIFKKFSALDSEGKGYVSVNDLLTQTELASHPLGERLARMMTYDLCEMIDFKLFCETISTFSDKAAPDKRLDLFFRMCDMDGDGLISDSELFVTIHCLTQGSMSEAQVQQIVEQVIAQADRDRDGKLNRREFYAVRTMQLLGLNDS
jgi:serine/threonine-protein phosphatase 2B regulatory subunit